MVDSEKLKQHTGVTYALLKELIAERPLIKDDYRGGEVCYFCGGESVHNWHGNDTIKHTEDCPYEGAKILIAVIENEKD